MFGLMNPGRQDTTFRRAYARCCQHQRRAYGLTSLGFLSYESALLYLFALDAGTLSPDDLPNFTCCRLRSLPSHTPLAERQVASFCAALGLLLASLKVSDDVRDGRSLAARMARWLLRRRFRAAYDYFERLDEGFAGRVDGFVADHLTLEKPGRPVPLADYTRPTANAFGYVFGLAARLPGLEARQELLCRLGQHVGAAIIAFDCAVDWPRDQRRGHFNPLPDGEESAAAALAYSRQRLTQAALECRAAFGDGSHTARALIGVGERIAARNRVGVCAAVRTSADERLRRWGVRKRGTFQVNAGWDVWGMAATLVAFGLSALRRLFAHLPDNPPEVPPDLPPQQPTGDVPPGTVPPPAVPKQRRKKESSGCCDLDCIFCGDCDCGGCEGLDCGGCDCSS
jgi:hypothetical protein